MVICLNCQENGVIVSKIFSSRTMGNGKSEITDEQVRRATRLYQKTLADRPKSAGDFFSRLNGDRWDDDYSGKFSRVDISYGRMSGSFFIDDFTQSEYVSVEAMIMTITTNTPTDSPK